jgi:hypothetical protein
MGMAQQDIRNLLSKKRDSYKLYTMTSMEKQHSYCSIDGYVENENQISAFGKIGHHTGRAD